jgi:hypothetical protein
MAIGIRNFAPSAKKILAHFAVTFRRAQDVNRKARRVPIPIAIGTIGIAEYAEVVEGHDVHEVHTKNTT